MNFKTFNFHHTVNEGIKSAGYQKPTPIQAEAISHLMDGLDLMGLAQTGTGKTAAFALPLLNRFMDGQRGFVRALIVAPTRELAEQIHNDICTLGEHTGIRSLPVYGGVNINPQTQKLKKGVEIIVACPGRLLDHMKRGNVDFSRLEVLILDEADQMLDMGFIPDIRRILKKLPANRQTLMFSATMPDEIRKLALEVLRRPITVKIGHSAPAETVSHVHFPVAKSSKKDLLLKLLEGGDVGTVLVFTRTKHRAKQLAKTLTKSGYSTASLQGNLSQNQRRQAMDGFKSGKYQILVATDIAARGIDVSDVSHVVNYDIPDTPEAYIHRIGRTGRAERSGQAFNLVTNEDVGIVRSIDRLLGSSVEHRVLEGFGFGEPGTETEPSKGRPGSGRGAVSGRRAGSGSGSANSRRPGSGSRPVSGRRAGSGSRPRNAISSRRGNTSSAAGPQKTGRS